MSSSKDRFKMDDLSLAVLEVGNMPTREENMPAREIAQAIASLDPSVSSGDYARYRSRRIRKSSRTKSAMPVIQENGSSVDSDEDNEGGGVSVAFYLDEDSASSDPVDKKETAVESKAVGTQQIPDLPETFGPVNIVEIYYEDGVLAASTSYNTFAPLAQNDGIPVSMFQNFALHTPVGGRPSSFFGPTHVLLFSGWIRKFHLIMEFVDNLTIEETDIIRRIAFHDDFFACHQMSLIPILKEFKNLEAVFLVSEYIFADDPDPCIGPYAEPPDHVEFITMQYVMDPNSSPTRQQAPYTPMDRVFEVESMLHKVPNVNWPSPIKVDLVSVRRNGRLRSFDRNLYTSPPFPKENSETEKQKKDKGKNIVRDEFQHPNSGDGSVWL